jgi:hypothetical protein
VKPAVLAFSLVSLLAAPSAAQDERALVSAIRGITVGPIENSQQLGRGYGTPYSEALLDHLASMGVTWISITPFGRIWSLTSTDIYMDFEAPYEENRVNVREMIAQAHERGIRVLLVPHLWMWNEIGWRGEIDPGSEEGWRAYQASYREFVLAWARDAALAEADAMSIGVECKSWSGRFGAYWYALIDEIRAIFPGLLTYSANWDEAEDVIFWDRLDFIGVQAFYPLHWEHDASYAQYLEGAARARDGLRALSELLDRPVLFVEIGYTTRRDAAVEPWTWPDGMTDVAYSEEEQARAMEALLTTFAPEPFFAGFFVWRYYANLDDISQEAMWGFSPHGKMAERVVRASLASGFGYDDETPGWLRAPSPEPLGRTFALWADTTVGD